MRGRYTARVAAHPLASFPPRRENCPPSLLQLCAPGVDLAWGLVPACMVGWRTAGWFGLISSARNGLKGG